MFWTEVQIGGSQHILNRCAIWRLMAYFDPRCNLAERDILSKVIFGIELHILNRGAILRLMAYFDTRCNLAVNGIF